MAYQTQKQPRPPPPATRFDAHGPPPPVNDAEFSETLKNMRAQAERSRLEGDQQLAQVLSHSREPSQEPTRSVTTARTSPAISRSQSRKTDKGKGKAVRPPSVLVNDGAIAAALQDGDFEVEDEEEDFMRALELSKQTAEFDRRARLQEEYLTGENHGAHTRGESSSSAHSRGPSGSSTGSSWRSDDGSRSHGSGADHRRVETEHDEEIARALAEEWHVHDIQDSQLHRRRSHHPHRQDEPSSKKERRKAERERERTETTSGDRLKSLPDLPSQDTTPKAKSRPTPTRREDPPRSSRSREQRGGGGDNVVVTPCHIPITVNPPFIPPSGVSMPPPPMPVPTLVPMPPPPSMPVPFVADSVLSPLPLTIQIPDLAPLPPPPPAKPSRSPNTPYSQHSSSSGHPSLYNSAEEGSIHPSSRGHGHGRHHSQHRQDHHHQRHRSQSRARQSTPQSASSSNSGSLSSLSSRNTLSTESSLTSTPPSSLVGPKGYEHGHGQHQRHRSDQSQSQSHYQSQERQQSHHQREQSGQSSASVAAYAAALSRAQQLKAKLSKPIPPRTGTTGAAVAAPAPLMKSSRSRRGSIDPKSTSRSGEERKAHIAAPTQQQQQQSSSLQVPTTTGSGHSRSSSSTTHAQQYANEYRNGSGHSRGSSLATTFTEGAPSRTSDAQSRSGTSSHLDTPQPRSATSSKPDTSIEVDPHPMMVSELFKYQDMFIGRRRCRNCDHRIKSPDKRVMPFPTRCITAQPIIIMLHLTCSACDAVYCRGCYRESRCPGNCMGEYPCPILNPCCLSIPALAIFEILSAFDSCYLSDPALTKPATLPNRDLFHDYIMAKGPSKEVKISESTPLEKAFVRTMENLHGWLPRVRHDGRPHLHPVIVHLFASSFFMEVLKRFLERDNEWYWIFHHETYVSIVKFLATVIECGLTTFISSPFPQIYESWGIHEHVWGRNTITWERERSSGAGRVMERAALKDSRLVDKLKKKRDVLVERKAQTRLPDWVKALELIVDGLNFFLVSVIVS